MNVVKLSPLLLNGIEKCPKTNAIKPRTGHIQELIVCTRPGRNGIPNMTTEIRNGKIISHCYGHGRAGWSWLWGTVEHTIEGFLDVFKEGDKTQKVTVIGAGCIGLYSSVRLHELGFTNIEVVARQIENTASMNAGGYFSPHTEDITDPEELKLMKKITQYNYRLYEQIQEKKHHIFKNGVSRVWTYGGAELHQGTLESLTGLESLVEDNVIPPPEPVLVDFGDGRKHKMKRFTSFYISGFSIMEQMLNQLKYRGIPLRFDTVHSFDDLSDSKIIFNCSGLGAKELNNDDKMVPIVGHLVALNNQDIENLQYIIITKYATKPVTEYNSFAEIPTIYYIPKKGGVLGGTYVRNYDGKDHQFNTQQFEGVIERGRHLFGTGNNPKPKL